jgi:hypothetical protein
MLRTLVIFWCLVVSTTALWFVVVQEIHGRPAGTQELHLARLPMEHPTPLCLPRSFLAVMELDDQEAIGGCEVCFVSALLVVEIRVQVLLPTAIQEIAYQVSSAVDGDATELYLPLDQIRSFKSIHGIRWLAQGRAADAIEDWPRRNTSVCK